MDLRAMNTLCMPVYYQDLPSIPVSPVTSKNFANIANALPNTLSAILAGPFFYF